jgi:acyl carrier protein
MENVETVVRDTIAFRLSVRPERVVPEARIVEDLGASSLDAVDTIMALEDAFGLDISDTEAEKLTTVGDVIVLMTMKAAYRERAETT